MLLDSTDKVEHGFRRGRGDQLGGRRTARLTLGLGTEAHEPTHDLRT
jgi:hypothetical protein